MPPAQATIEVVRGELSEERAQQVLNFLSRQGALEPDAARRRLSEVVCLALDGREIVGVGSAYPQQVALIGGRPFWIYHSYLSSDDSDERWDRMFNAAFDVLADQFEETGAGPVGACVIVADPAEMERRPEAVWPDTDLMFAGYLESGSQVRIRYFRDAPIGPGLPNSPTSDDLRDQVFTLDDRYRILPLAETGEVSADDVLQLWAREGAVPAAEAQRRVREVSVVAKERDEGVVGVSSVYLRHNPQLRTDLWHYRTYVARAHRNSNLAAQLLLSHGALLDERYVSGEDTRAPGTLFEIENEGLKRFCNQARMSLQAVLIAGVHPSWTFIGENDRGDHVRVHYFPGARVTVSEP
jgi:hypothetical protein